MHATRAAVEEGIVPGGGTTLVNIIPALDNVKAEGDEAVGVNIVRRALSEPLRQIARNAGFEGSVIVERVKSEKPGIGFNAATEEFVDMVKAGVVDPAKVTRTRSAKRCEHRRHAPHHGGRHLRDAEEGEGPRHATRGRHGLLNVRRAECCAPPSSGRRREKDPAAPGRRSFFTHAPAVEIRPG